MTKASLETGGAGVKPLPVSPTCSICQREFTEFGNNAWPVNDGRCCDACNATAVCAARWQLFQRSLFNQS
jgi:hypothetical protein